MGQVRSFVLRVDHPAIKNFFKNLRHLTLRFAAIPERARHTQGMKKHIREMLDDLRKRQTKKPPVVNLTVPPKPPLPRDLENQILSKNHEERVRQFDFQAQQSEEEQTIGQ
jgi:hypothetical protein